MTLRQAHHPRPGRHPQRSGEGAHQARLPGEPGPLGSSPAGCSGWLDDLLYHDDEEVARIDETMRLLFPTDFCRLQEAVREVTRGED